MSLDVPTRLHVDLKTKKEGRDGPSGLALHHKAAIPSLTDRPRAGQCLLCGKLKFYSALLEHEGFRVEQGRNEYVQE